MQKEILLDMVAQNQATCLAVLNKITEENAHLRLNQTTASAGFIYRHLGETLNRFGLFFRNTDRCTKYDNGQIR